MCSPHKRLRRARPGKPRLDFFASKQRRTGTDQDNVACFQHVAAVMEVVDHDSPQKIPHLSGATAWRWDFAVKVSRGQRFQGGVPNTVASYEKLQEG